MSPLCKWLIVGGLVIAVPSVTFATDAAALAKRLHNAADASSLDDPALKPWHLKLAVQIYDAKGKPSEQGTVEEWWTPDADKRVYQSASYSATEIRTREGLRRTAGQPTAPYLLDAIRERVVHPMATSEEIDESQPDLRVESFGKVKLDCVMLSQPIKNVAYPPLGLFPTYCLDQKSDLLRLSYQFGSESGVLNTMGKFQGRSVALDPSISIDGLKAVSAHIVTLEAKTFDPTIFTSGPELEEHSATLTKIGAGVMQGMRIKSVPPAYPATAKANHTTGSVHLRAIIGTDGRIHSLRIIDAPDPSLAISALAAVRQWEYRPYTLNGLPTDVDTTITVNYAMSP